MWITDQAGLAVWRDEHSDWVLDTRDGRFEISRSNTDADRASDQPPKRAEPWVSFTPVDRDAFPPSGEQFVRGDELHLSYPQGSTVYELRFALQPIESGEQHIVLQATVGIQTDLLDSHPQIDIVAAGNAVEPFGPMRKAADSDTCADNADSSTAISVASSHDHSVCVLLGPHDSPFTVNHSTDSMLRLRLFGDFLEKGVIRTARVWFVISRGKVSPTEKELLQWWKLLSESPLPLTA